MSGASVQWAFNAAKKNMNKCTMYIEMWCTTYWLCIIIIIKNCE